MADKPIKAEAAQPIEEKIAAIKAKGKWTIELPNTGGFFIVTYTDQNRNRYGVLYNPNGEPISMR